MFIVDDALTAKVIILANTAFVSHPFDGLHFTLIAFDFVSYNIIFFFGSLLLYFISKFLYLRLLGFLLNFWLIFLRFCYFLLDFILFSFEFCDRFDDVCVGVEHISLILLLLHIDFRLFCAVFQVNEDILVGI
jgi:hypothetical protein